MNHLFVPYKIALKLKEKGFNEPCLKSITETGFENDYSVLGAENWNKLQFVVSIPMYQQVVDWFRNNKNIEITIYSVNARKYAYSFEFMEAWDKKDKDFSLTIVDQVIYTEKKGVKTFSVKEFEEMNLSYYKALDKAIEEALKLI